MKPDFAYWLLALLPAVFYLLIYGAHRRVLAAKRREISTLLMRGETLTKYVTAYGSRSADLHGSSGTSPTDDAFEVDVDEVVEELFALNHSPQEYCYALAFTFIPVVAISAFGLILARLPIALPAGLKAGIVESPTSIDILIGGISAMIWSTYELLSRYRQGDLFPDSFFGPGIRILAASGVSATIGYLIKEPLAQPVAFAIGALSPSALVQYLVKQARSALKLPSPVAEESQPPLSSIQGLSGVVRDKLARAGISTVHELALYPPFDILLRTTLNWRVILDLSDQAVLALYLGDKIENIRPMGIRSATEFAELEWFKEDFRSDADRERTIHSLAEALALSDVQVKLLIQTLEADVSVNFLSSLWAEDTPDDDDDDNADETAEAITPAVSPR